MSEKTEIIVGVLLEQAKKQEDIAAKSFRDSIEHKGAEQALSQLGKQVLGMVAGVESQIRADDTIGPEAGTAMLAFGKRLLLQVARTCSDNAKNQEKQSVLAEGRSDQAKLNADLFRKEAEVKRAHAANREAIAEEVAKAVTPPKKKATRKKAPAKRKPATKRKPAPEKSGK